MNPLKHHDFEKPPEALLSIPHICRGKKNKTCIRVYKGHRDSELSEAPFHICRPKNETSICVYEVPVGFVKPFKALWLQKAHGQARTEGGPVCMGLRFEGPTPPIKAKGALGKEY